MAAVTDVQLVTISVNDIEVQVPKGEMIVESVKRVGFEIPIFCYHSRLKPVGMCRMCLVEVAMKGPDGSIRKMPKPQAACTLPASEGLIIQTETPSLHVDRRGVLEFLLVNHPLDCPICDRGGECPLQNNTIFYGPSTSRFVEMKRHAPKAFPLSEYVTLDLERCIQCGRCVRFTEEISGDGQLGFRFRGANMQPTTFEMRDFSSKFSGNVIEICPVGALTSSKYRFRARPWDLETKPGICTLCSNGCNVHVDYRRDQIVRINGRVNEAINEEWTCDRGKFGHDALNSDSRLTAPMVRVGNTLATTDWPTAYAQIAKVFRGPSCAVLGGASLSNEDLYALHKLWRGPIGSKNIDHRFTATLPGLDEEPPLVTCTIQSLEHEKAILVFGTSLADSLPIVFLRVRKAWLNHGTKVVVAHDSETDVDSFAHLLLRYNPGTESVVAAGLAGTLDPAEVEAQSGIKAADLTLARALLEGAPTITTREVYNAKNALDIVRDLGKHGRLNVFETASNGQGAREMRAAMISATRLDGGLDTHEILQGCIKGTIRALWLIGSDILTQYPDQAVVAKALETVEFLVIQDHSASDLGAYASVILPATAPTESAGSYTNVERRFQQMGQVLAPKGAAKPAWRIYSELEFRIRPGAPSLNLVDKLAALRSEVPAFAAATDGELLA